MKLESGEEAAREMGVNLRLVIFSGGEREGR